MSQIGRRWWTGRCLPARLRIGAPCIATLLACIALRGQGPAAELAPFEVAQRLRQAAMVSPNDAAAQRAYSEFLERYRDPQARTAYLRLTDALDRMNAPAAERASAQQQLVLLDLLAGDRDSAARHLAKYTAAGGTGMTLPDPPVALSPEYIEIPGPLRSFARMAALSSELSPSEILPALARTVVISGYRAPSASDALEQTEYLTLVLRYLSQARELEKLAGPDKQISIAKCDSAETGVLLRVIGYRMRGACGTDLVLETLNASRAFLTTDSGFPLGELEVALRTNRPFSIDYHPTRVPILFTREYWQPVKDQTDRPFIDYFISDPSLTRLYVAISKLDPQTAEVMRAAIPAARFKLFAHVLDFFGAMFRIRDGRAVVPGGVQTQKVWEKLNGVSPEKGVAFFERMLIQDDGWLASYYDALARIHGPVQTYLLEPDRLERHYDAIRGKVTTPGPARPVFQSNTDMLLLTTRLRLDPDGKPHLPGGLETWKHLVADPPKGAKVDPKIKKDSSAWKTPDQVIEALFGLSRKQAENQHLKIFMALTDLDRRRTQPLEASVVEQLARRYEDMRDQYPLLSEAASLRGETMLAYLDTAQKLSEMRSQSRRLDAVGMFQGLAGLWQILVRQGTLPQDRADAALMSIVGPFATLDNDRQLFDAGRSGVQTLLAASGSSGKDGAQNRMMDLLAGTTLPTGADAYQHMAQDLIRVFEAQRLVSLDTLFDLADHLQGVGKGQPLNAAVAGRLANRISEIQLPQGDLTGMEKSSAALGFWADRHVADQRKLNLRRDIEKAGNNGQELADLRSSLTPYLRDTLVGFNYMYYAPPGAQILHTNPLFVRSHDFVGPNGSGQTWKATALFGSGWPHSGGGRLSGSLSGLPYALAEAEQNFLVPTQTQALIWGDLVPQMMLSAVVPRFWNVTRNQMHWVGLHTAYGEALLAEAALNSQRRAEVMDALDLYLSPKRLKNVEDVLAAGDIVAARDSVLPSELYLLARSLTQNRNPIFASSELAAEIRRMEAAYPKELSEASISRAFGSPKPSLANSYQPELMNLRTFPTLMGYSSRMLAESWESNLLYFAALADQIHAGPDDLNTLVPQWTQMTVERIFATHLEDWPALLRSLHVVGNQVRREANAQVAEAPAVVGGNAQ